MSTIEIDFSSDWHIGNPQAGKDYPALTDIQAALDSALARGVDAFVVAGDFIEKGQEQYAQVAASLLGPYVEKGLNVVGILGNHDFINGSGEEATKILAEAGVKMLEGSTHIVPSRTGDEQVTILGVSGEIGPEYDNWWRNGKWDWDAYEKAHIAASPHREALQQQLAAMSDGSTAIVVSHRSIVPETIGDRARELGFVSAQTKGFADILDEHAKRLTITAVSGHDHDIKPWQGYPFGTTKEGRPSHNVSSPMRRRLNMPLVQTLRF